MYSEEVIEQFKCPVCFDIPPGKVFQCESGHIVCNQCQRSLQECPVCRIPYGNCKIRNRQIELVLDRMKFPCRKRDEGCVEMFERLNIKGDYENCEDSYGKDICKQVGYNCAYTFNENYMRNYQKHLKWVHGAVLHLGHEAEILLEICDLLPSQGNKIWKPVLFSLRKKFLLVSRFDSKSENLTWACVILCDPGESSKYYVKLTIVSAKKTAPDIEWRLSCVRYVDTEKALAANSFHVPIAYIREHFVGLGGLTVRAALRSDKHLGKIVKGSCRTYIT